MHEGEIAGIAAVAGNGQAELANAILGVADLEHGAVRLGGRDYTHASTADRLQQGLVAVIPEDPLEQGAVPSMSVGDNLLLTTRCIPGKGRFFLRSRRLRQEAAALAEAAPFEMPAPERELAGLSGGNVQRVLTARELTQHATQIVAYYPSRGLDVASARSVQRLLVEACDRGHVPRRDRVRGPRCCWCPRISTSCCRCPIACWSCAAARSWAASTAGTPTRSASARS